LHFPIKSAASGTPARNPALGLWPRSGYEAPTQSAGLRRALLLGQEATRAGRPHFDGDSNVVKVIASEVRKGNVLDIDGALCTVLKAESIRPGKGTPTTHIDMRRISDGVKIVKSYRTTESVERAYLDEKTFNYLYEDDMGFNFMEPETFEQISISKDLIGDQSIWLQENMTCQVQLFEGTPVAIELPPRVTLEIVEADPVVKGQTASSSYKPAKLANGARVMVPPHIGAGTRVVVTTENGEYVERARD
jgi:elongation factor P